MAIGEREFEEAGARMRRLRDAAHAVAARYDARRDRIVVSLHTGLELVVPRRLVPDLAGASPDEVSAIEVSPSGLGLHWPRLDVDLYVPAVLEGRLGPEKKKAEAEAH